MSTSIKQASCQSHTEALAAKTGLLYNPNTDLASHNGTTFFIAPLSTMGGSLMDLTHTKRCVFFEDEWLRKKEIVLSIVNHKLGKTINRAYARNCVVVKVPNKTAKDFFDANHISGATSSVFNLGLLYNDQLISCISFRKPFVKKYGNAIEISRFASLIDTSIVGGLSKLISTALTTTELLSFDTLLTYADRRFGDGECYTTVGFEFVGKTKEDYFYTNGVDRFGRFKFRAQSGLSEKDYAKNCSVYKITGCGSCIFERKLR